ncbi:MAG: ATP-binding cassette domain-containing protein [Bdellovibrionales bacterium]|nr:ATP-binding cassette domain-containing protein [Bdellovibrionales bacterium]
MISVRGVSKSFGSQVVLSRLNLEVEQGRTTTIVGPSGAGKSVLLKLIMGILSADEGEIDVCGYSVTNASSEAEKNQIRENLGVLFQSAALFDSLTVYDNIAFPLTQCKLQSREQAHERVVSLARSLSLVKYLNKLPQEVSIGIRKRVGLARALAVEPKVLLFDEPNTGLDPLVGQEVYDLIAESQKNQGFTGVVISHELPEVFQVSDRVVMLLRGKIIMEGTPDDFLSTDNPEVVQFLHGYVDGPIRIQ